MMPGGEYPAELVQAARRAVWYDDPEQTSPDLPTFLAHLMAYDSPARPKKSLRLTYQSWNFKGSWSSLPRAFLTRSPGGAGMSISVCRCGGFLTVRMGLKRAGSWAVSKCVDAGAGGALQVLSC